MISCIIPAPQDIGVPEATFTTRDGKVFRLSGGLVLRIYHRGEHVRFGEVEDYVYHGVHMELLGESAQELPAFEPGVLVCQPSVTERLTFKPLVNIDWEEACLRAPSYRAIRLANYFDWILKALAVSGRLWPPPHPVAHTGIGHLASATLPVWAHEFTNAAILEKGTLCDYQNLADGGLKADEPTYVPA